LRQDVPRIFNSFNLKILIDYYVTIKTLFGRILKLPAFRAMHVISEMFFKLVLLYKKVFIAVWTRNPLAFLCNVFNRDAQNGITEFTIYTHDITPNHNQNLLHPRKFMNQEIYSLYLIFFQILP